MSAGAVPSPNIWHHPAVYEIENAAIDREGLIESALAPWTGRDVLDVGCGSGYHLPRWADGAASVVGVEPHAGLAAMARRRTRALPRVAVLQGSATRLPLPDASVDWVQARWAYFFGPGCEPGLAELDRVVRRGGVAHIIDNDPTTSTFGRWFRRGYPEVDPVAVERFWSTRGWTRTPVLMHWTFDSRADLEAVVGIEFTPAVAAEIVAEHEGLVVDYAVNVWRREF
ncbi:class I SAM-dependent methyltransferase [Alteromonas gracilis]